MTALEDELAPDILEAFNEYAVPATFTAQTGTFSPSTGAITGGPTVYTSRALPPVPVKQALLDEMARGSSRLIQSGDLVTYTEGAAAIGFTPRPGMKITIDGRTLLVVDVRKYLSIAFQIFARGI